MSNQLHVRHTILSPYLQQESCLHIDQKLLESAEPILTNIFMMGNAPGK